MDKWPATEDDADSKSKPVFSKRIESAPLIDRDEPGRGSKAKYIGLVCLGLFILVLLVYFGGRAMTGYAVYGAMQQQGVPAQYASDMGALASAKSAAEADAQAARDELAQGRAQLEAEQAAMAQEKAQMEQERESHAATKASLEGDVKRYQTSLAQSEQERAEAQTALADSAKRVCCAQRAVADPNINSYSIDDGKVVCSDSGDQQLSC